jgi:hypothetical protein
MKRACRTFIAFAWRLESVSTVLRHARIVTDPKKIAQLHAEAARQKRPLENARRGRM